MIEIGTTLVGADVTHHFKKFALVIKLSYILSTVSVLVLQGEPVPVAVPLSVRSAANAVPHTLNVPPPPQICDEMHEPQLSVPPQPSPMLPQFLPCAKHVVDVHKPPLL